MKKLYLLLLVGVIFVSSPTQSDKDLEKAKELQKKIHKALNKSRPAYVFIGGGSGVCISKDGWILSNHHVAGETGANHTVVFTGGKSYEASVIGHDSNWDVSLLKVDGEDNLPFVEMGDSDKLNTGDHCFAIGNPWKVGSETADPHITFGVVSAKFIFFDAYSAAIQTDAQINPGNSGGPLIDLDGKLIGINGRIQWRLVGRVNTGLGYAIPISAIKRFLPHFKNGGRVKRGYMEGVILAEPDFQQYEEGEYGDGVLVVGLTEKTHAEMAGLKEGDIITEIAGFRTFNLNKFHGVIGCFPPGDTVDVKYKRKEKDGKWKEHVTKVKLGASTVEKKDDKEE